MICKCGNNKFLTRYKDNKPVYWVCTECKGLIPYESVKNNKKKYYEEKEVE